MQKTLQQKIEIFDLQQQFLEMLTAQQIVKLQNELKRPLDEMLDDWVEGDDPDVLPFDTAEQENTFFVVIEAMQALDADADAFVDLAKRVQLHVFNLEDAGLL
jgi:hypothetical protein